MNSSGRYVKRPCCLRQGGSGVHFARLSYGQARALLDEHTAMRGPGTGWDLHEYRHSSLTHLGEAGASLLLLMAKSRHKKPETVRRYFKPPPEAIAKLTSLLAPGDSRR